MPPHPVTAGSSLSRGVHFTKYIIAQIKARRDLHVSFANLLSYFAALFSLMLLCKKLTISHRWLLGRFSQAGMPEVSLPVVMNQNNSPAFALRTTALSSAG